MAPRAGSIAPSLVPDPDLTDPAAEPDDGRPGGSAWVRPVALAVSMLVIGFVVGWILRGDDGPVTVLPPAAQTTVIPTELVVRQSCCPLGR